MINPQQFSGIRMQETPAVSSGDQNARNLLCHLVGNFICHSGSPSCSNTLPVWSLDDYSSWESCMAQCVVGRDGSQLQYIEDLLHITWYFPNQEIPFPNLVISRTQDPPEKSWSVLVICIWFRSFVPEEFGGWWGRYNQVKVPMP